MSSDDLVNISAAMGARGIHDDVRVVLRVGDGEVANETRSLLALGVVRDVHRIAAALLAMMLLGEEPESVVAWRTTLTCASRRAPGARRARHAGQLERRVWDHRVMAQPSIEDQLREGWRALEEARWRAAQAAFEAALAGEETPDALDGLGQALWFLGAIEEAIAARERAFEELRARPAMRPRRARRRLGLAPAPPLGTALGARGWLARAERALEGAGPCAGHGWVAVERARHAESVEECAEHARRAMTIARETGADDLEVFALSLLGRAEVGAGRLREGMQLLEEAMAAASAGRVRNVHTLGEAYCNLIMACTSAGEWERAAEWCELVDDFAREHGVTPLFGACRTVHADVLLAAGRWPEAELALESALATHARYVPEMGAPTVATMAELRIRQGRLPEAEQLLAGREEHPSSLRALALLRIAEDEPQRRGRAARTRAGGHGGRCDARHAAARAARRRAPGLRRRGGRRERRAPSSRSSRATRGSGWSRRAPTWPQPAWRSRRDRRRGRRARAPGARRVRPARDAARRGRGAARARPRARRRAPDLARDEARTAFASFRELGASRAMDAAAAVLRDLGAGTAARPRSYGELTAREQEVLGLMARGDVERADRPDAVHQREDRRPPREPHPLEARRAQPRRGRRPRGARRGRGVGTIGSG